MRKVLMIWPSYTKEYFQMAISPGIRSLERHVALPHVHRYSRNLHSCTQSVSQSHNAIYFCFAPDWCYLPVTVCIAERSFSSMKLLKSYLPSTIKQERLSNLALIYIHKVEDVIDRFAAKNRRLNCVYFCLYSYCKSIFVFVKIFLNHPPPPSPPQENILDPPLSHTLNCQV